MLFILLLTDTLLYAEDLDVLLDKYQSASELSKKTNDENAGHVVVYTRDDLERMQVETLKDVLKSLRYFRYLENRTAEPDLLNNDPVLYSSKSIRIYLNETELALPITGSGFLLFGNMDMDFIDHVEIYEGFPSFEFGIEPATIVIRLYSKSAEHDEGGRIKGLVASHNSHKENIYLSGIEDDMSYFVYANHSEDNRKEYNLENETLKRDYTTNQFYGSFSKQNYKVELHAMKQTHDAFLGNVPVDVPKGSEIKRDFLNVSLESKFLDDTLLFNLSYIHTNERYEAVYSTPLPVVIGGYYSIKQNYKTDSLTAILRKKLTFDIHTLSFGLQYRYKSFNFGDIQKDTNIIPYHQTYDREDIYSFFIEDSIMISENSLVGFSLMQQYYDRNHHMTNESLTQLRLSYIYSTESFVSKTFASRQEFVPEPYMTATEYIGNPNLEPEIYYGLTQEFSYKYKNTLSKFLIGYNKTEKYLMPNSQINKIDNAQRDLNLLNSTIELTYFFRKKDKLQLEVDYTRLDLPDTEDHIVNHFNYLVRMLNSVGKFDIFNELVINSGFEDLTTGYDYSAGIKYRATKDFHIGLKGENIFNKGLTRKYYYNLFPTIKQFEVPVIEQKFMLSMEYLF